MHYTFVSTYKNVSVSRQKNTRAQAARASTRFRRGELFEPKCPSREILRDVTSRWGALVLVALLSGTYRFSELRRRIGGVSEKMLAQTLQKLEADGFVRRRSLPVVPPHVEYSLTPLGKEIAEQVESLTDWIESNMPRILRSSVTAG